MKEWLKDIGVFILIACIVVILALGVLVTLSYLFVFTQCWR